MYFFKLNQQIMFYYVCFYTKNSFAFIEYQLQYIQPVFY